MIARGKVRRVFWLLFGAAVASAIALRGRADETVTLTQRQFVSGSAAAPFQAFFSEARRLAASTTPAWNSVDGDLGAWGPALIFPLLARGVPHATVSGLAAPLATEGTVPVLLFRTIGLYAAKSQLAFTDTPTLRAAIDRNLRTLERAAGDAAVLPPGPEFSGWGSIGAGAWLAYLELLHRDYFDLDDASGARWSTDGVRRLDQLLVRGQSREGGFRREPRDEQLALWPSVLAMYALVKAYENEELVRYESAAIKAAAAIEGLRADDGSYFSTPEKTVKDVRANIYCAGALLLLFKDTGDAQYRERAVAVLRWVTGGAGAAVIARDAGLSAHVAYLALLLDSLTTQPYENLLGRRPMRVTVELGTATAQDMAARLRPADFRYREMFDGVLRTLVERTPHAAGDFAYDYGDAPGYAADVLLAAGDTALAAEIIQRQQRLLSWPHPRDFDEISFGVGALFAAFEHPDAVDATAADASLRRYLLLSGGVAFADRYYLDGLDWLTNGGGFEYGPTVLGAQIAATQLRYAARFPDRKVGWLLHPLQVGRALIDAADQAAWNAGRHVYRAYPPRDTIWLLPNAMMIIDLLQLHQLTSEATYLGRAEEVATGLEVLWDERRGAYFANAEQTGDNAYQSLSTNSYAALALLRLYEATQKAPYRDRALRVFDFMRRDLYAGGVLAHHLYHGRRAGGDVWCTGCNWRVLSELMEVARVLK
jgi:hypothetical protein